MRKLNLDHLPTMRQMGAKLGNSRRTEEYHKRHSEKIKLKWQDPEFRRMMCEKRKLKWQDPEFRRMMCEKRKNKDYRPFVRYHYTYYTPAGVFSERAKAAEANNINVNTLTTRVKSNSKNMAGYYRIKNA